MPRARSIAIQSERVLRRSPLALTCPAIWMAPPNSRSFSVSVVLPASGCEMIAKVLRRLISLEIADSDPATNPHHVHMDVHKIYWTSLQRNELEPYGHVGGPPLA